MEEMENKRVNVQMYLIRRQCCCQVSKARQGAREQREGADGGSAALNKWGVLALANLREEYSSKKE